jgi:hypothetical protein
MRTVLKTNKTKTPGTMNLFWLSVIMSKNAKYHCDQHVVKMPLEAVQLLYTAWSILEPEQQWRRQAPLNKAGTEHGYRATHRNHPLARWVRRSTTNYQLCADYALALCAEYTRRYSKHLHVEQHAVWLKAHVPSALQSRSMTPIPICTSEPGKAKTMQAAVDAYRRGYRKDKLEMARYRHSKPPSWLTKIEQINA